MGLMTRRGATAQTEDACQVIIANTPALIKECLQLRHQVYCLEKGYFEPTAQGQETDDHDQNARHILLKHRDSDEAIGTARIVLLNAYQKIGDLPMAHVCPPGLLRALPPNTTGEVSRVAVSKLRRSGMGAGRMMRLGLFQGIMRLSSELGLTHWAAIMEPMLHRLLTMDSLHFRSLGPLVEYHGLRQPTYSHIETCMSQLRDERPDIWGYITLEGSLLKPRTPAQVWEPMRELALELA